MAIQTGQSTIVARKKEASYGVLPTNDATARRLRRTKISLALSKTMIQSEEMRDDNQVVDSRHGMRNAGGNIDGELSCGSYSDLMESAVRRNFAAVTTLSALTNVTASATAPHFVRAAGSWISEGLRVGMTVRMTGWTTTGTANNGKNLTITALTATGITVAEAVAAKASGDSVVVSIPGKVTYVPSTGHTNDSYAIEEWAPSAGQSRRYLGQRVNTIDIAIPPNEKATISVNFVGKDRAKAGTQYFTSASAPGATGMHTGVSGSLFVNGTRVAIVTNLSLKLMNDQQTEGVIGDNTTPDVFPGICKASGSLTVLYTDDTFDGYFDDETAVSLVFVFKADLSSATSDFLTFALPKLKLSGGSKEDRPQAVRESYDFTASKGDGSNGWESTTFWIQDSAAP